MYIQLSRELPNRRGRCIRQSRGHRSPTGPVAECVDVSAGNDRSLIGCGPVRARAMLPADAGGPRCSSPSARPGAAHPTLRVDPLSQALRRRSRRRRSQFSWSCWSAGRRLMRRGHRRPGADRIEPFELFPSHQRASRHRCQALREPPAPVERRAPPTAWPRASNWSARPSACSAGRLNWSLVGEGLCCDLSLIPTAIGG